MTPTTTDLLAVTYVAHELSISTDTRYTKRGEPRPTGRWAVYCRGRKLHGDLPTSTEAGWVRDLYLEGASADDPRWSMVGGKQPSPRADDVRRASEAAAVDPMPHGYHKPQRVWNDPINPRGYPHGR
jgi:hypothetical protein